MSNSIENRERKNERERERERKKERAREREKELDKKGREGVKLMKKILTSGALNPRPSRSDRT